MANLHILAIPPTDSGTFSGGSWTAGLPLSNLKTQQPREVARSANALTTSSRFVVDMGGVFPISMFALVAHNFSAGATVRFRVSDFSSGATPLLDETVDAVPFNVIWGAEPWGAFPWEGIRPDDQPGGPITFYKHSETVYGQFVLVDIDDTDNPAGYIQLGRFKAGDAFIPATNFAYGAALKFIDESRKSRSVGGQLYSDKKPKRRQFSCSFDYMSERDAYGGAYDLQRLLGATDNLLIVYDPEDAASVILRRTIYGVMTELDDLVTARTAASGVPYSWRLAVEELV